MTEPQHTTSANADANAPVNAPANAHAAADTAAHGRQPIDENRRGAASEDGRTSSAAIRVRDVSFAYRARVPIVRNCSLDFQSGRIVGLLGPNGSGKTTLLKLIAGALVPDAGTIVRASRIGYVPQILQLSFSYRVLDVVLMGRAQQIGMFATPSRADIAAAHAALDRLGIGAFADRSFDELSGGERQLVAFARAIASDARILVLDEPTSALDLRHQQTVLAWIRRLAREDGYTIVFSTHQPQHADLVADDIVLIESGGRVDFGARDVMLTAERVGALFGVEMARATLGETRVLVPSWDL